MGGAVPFLSLANTTPYSRLRTSFFYLPRKCNFVKSALESIRFFSYKHKTPLPFGPERYPVQDAKH